MSTTSELRKGWFRYALTQCRDNSTVAMTDDEITAEWGLVRADRLSELERENAALREAVDFFVEHFDAQEALHKWDSIPSNGDYGEWQKLYERVEAASKKARHARAALAGSGEK